MAPTKPAGSSRYSFLLLVIPRASVQHSWQKITPLSFATEGVRQSRRMRSQTSMSRDARPYQTITKNKEAGRRATSHTAATAPRTYESRSHRGNSGRRYRWFARCACCPQPQSQTYHLRCWKTKCWWPDAPDAGGRHPDSGRVAGRHLARTQWTRQFGWRYAKRPGVDEFLTALAPLYEILLWTDALSSAEPVSIDKLDARRLIRHRLYHDATTYTGGLHR